MKQLDCDACMLYCWNQLVPCFQSLKISNLQIIVNLLKYMCARNYHSTQKFDKAIIKIKRCNFLPHMVQLHNDEFHTVEMLILKAFTNCVVQIVTLCQTIIMHMLVVMMAKLDCWLIVWQLHASLQTGNLVNYMYRYLRLNVARGWDVAVNVCIC